MSTNEGGSCCGVQKTARTTTSIICGSCHQTCKTAHFETLLHTLNHPWQTENTDYGYCANPKCDRVYQGETGAYWTKAALRVTDLLCYCFNISHDDYAQNPQLKDFVAEQTKNKNCACRQRNPSGQCCLKDFAKIINPD